MEMEIIDNQLADFPVVNVNLKTFMVGLIEP